MTQTGPPTLLLLHHFGGSSRTRSGVIDRLALKCRAAAWVYD